MAVEDANTWLRENEDADAEAIKEKHSEVEDALKDLVGAGAGAGAAGAGAEDDEDDDSHDEL